MIIQCQNCGKYHESLTICPELRLTFEPHKEVAPLPPTAEQTSIARFNALADQIRELSERLNNGHISVMAELERRMDGLQERQDQHREEIASWLDESARDSARRHNRHDSEHMNLDKKIDSLTSMAVVPDGLFSYRQRMERALLRIERRLRATRTKPRAVAKKKAAPLVGKKGTGRKG